ARKSRVASDWRTPMRARGGLCRRPWRRGGGGGVASGAPWRIRERAGPGAGALLLGLHPFPPPVPTPTCPNWTMMVRAQEKTKPDSLRATTGNATTCRVTMRRAPRGGETPMPSPFPGMNPYLEQSSVWHDFHQSFLPTIRELLTPQVVPRYFV